MKNRRVVILLVTGYWLLGTNCYAAPVSSDELIQNAKEYDGKEVVFQGEVIGDIMRRGKFSWVNIFDGKKAVGAFLDKSVFDDVIFTGDYNHKGDIIEVNGVFHRACLEHGGDLDIHVYRMTKLRDGYKVVRSINQKKVRMVLWLAIILVGLVSIVMGRKRLGMMGDDKGKWGDR